MCSLAFRLFAVGRSYEPSHDTGNGIPASEHCLGTNAISPFVHSTKIAK